MKKDVALLDPIDNDVLKDYTCKDLILPIFYNPPVITHQLSYFLLYLQRSLTYASILKEPLKIPTVYDSLTSRKVPLKLLTTINVFNNLECVVYKVKNTYLIVFKGTTTLKESFVDLDYKLLETKMYNGRVHQGFYEFYSIIRKKLIPIVKTFNLNSTIVVSGISLGASMAKLCIADIIQLKNYNFSNQCCLIDFACPKTGDQEFVEWFKVLLDSKDVNFISYMNKSDIIPKIGPKSTGFYKQRYNVEFFNIKLKGMLNNHIVSYFDYFSKEKNIKICFK
jgi:hypothetical protein